MESELKAIRKLLFLIVVLLALQGIIQALFADDLISAVRSLSHRDELSDINKTLKLGKCQEEAK